MANTMNTMFRMFLIFIGFIGNTFFRCEDTTIICKYVSLLMFFMVLIAFISLFSQTCFYHIHHIVTQFLAFIDEVCEHGADGIVVFMIIDGVDVFRLQMIT